MDANTTQKNDAYAEFNRLRDDRFQKYSERQAFHMALDFYLNAIQYKPALPVKEK
jgi:hypothetical protein